MYKKALVAVSQFAFLVAGNPVPSSTSQEASSAASTPSTASATASSTSAEFHTQPALRGSNFDYGTSSPQSVLQSLSQHCGALNCDPSWTVPYQYIKSSSLVSGTLKVTVTDADWDGAAIGKNMTGGIVSLGGVGVNKTSSSYYDYSNGGVDGQEKKVDTYKGFSELALGRFDSVSRFKNPSRCAYDTDRKIRTRIKPVLLPLASRPAVIALQSMGTSRMLLTVWVLSM